MPKKNFLLLSLEDKEAKDVANIVGNATSRKILDFLTEKEGTESEIAKTLSIPLPTVHYNLQQLKKAKLVETEEFHYSKKGKEILHYKLANKYIIIAPKKESGLRQRLNSIFSVLLVGAGVSGLLHWWQQNSLLSTLTPTTSPQAAPFATAPLAARSVEESADAAVAIEPVAESAALKAVPTLDAATSTLPEVTHLALVDSIGFWFFCGLLFTVILYSIIQSYRGK